MVYDRSFRFARDELNRQLIDTLRGGAFEFVVRDDGGVSYRSEDEGRFEDVLVEVRGRVFPDWQVLSFPLGWAARYRAAMATHSVPYEEEVNNGEVEFLLPGSYEPHAWQLG